MKVLQCTIYILNDCKDLLLCCHGINGKSNNYRNKAIYACQDSFCCNRYVQLVLYGTTFDRALHVTGHFVLRTHQVVYTRFLDSGVKIKRYTMALVKRAKFISQFAINNFPTIYSDSCTEMSYHLIFLLDDPFIFQH